jgi:hypothetical protein
MTKVQIICTSPGMRRNGIEHPASAFYEKDRWTDKQLAAFKADPSFVIREIDPSAESVNTDVDFQLAVAAEVKVQLAGQAALMRASYDQAVTDAAKEKVDDLQTKLDDANTKIAALQAQVDAAAANGGQPKK